MRNFKEYLVWQKSMDLTVVIYDVTNKFPSEEKFGLISQIRRAVVSIPSNIAEGAAASTQKHFGEYLQRSLGSAFEVETQLLLSKRLNYISDEVYTEIINQITEVQKMLYSLIKKLKE
jgi:four helix bundle protein